MEEEDDATESGSPFRMQQLLSLFFPAYGMRSPECRTALIASTGPMLTAVSAKLRKKGVKISDWPVAKMVEYIESLLDTGSGNDTKETTSTNEDANSVASSQDNDGEAAASPQESSHSGRVAVEVSRFLLKEQVSLNTTILRQLCKTLGTTNIDVDLEDPSTLSKLKKNLEELGMYVTDSTALRSLKPITEVLDAVEVDEDDGESTVTEEDSEDESLAEVLKAIEIAKRESMEAIEKENEKEISVDGKVSVDDAQSTQSRGRRRLAPVNQSS